MKPDGAQVPGDECVHNLAHPVSSLTHFPFPCGWYGYVRTVVTPLRVRTVERLKKDWKVMTSNTYASSDWTSQPRLVIRLDQRFAGAPGP